MTPQELKSSILQLAVQGKLVEQRPEEGSAEELYRQIQAEKQKLIKEGKIKKEKPLTVITEDEIPFDIPESWKWVRWGELSQSIQYGYNAPALTTGRIRMVRISDIHENKVIWDTVPFCKIDDNEISNYLLAANDILFARTGGTVGKSFLVKDVPYEAVYAGYLIRTRYSELLVPEYLKLFMESQLYWNQLRSGTIATAQPNCNGKTLSKMILPLPPLAEQKRIVAKIEELLPLIDRYEQAWSKLEAFNKRFPDDMQKSVLQMAIQGKLVEQRPEEGTGEELYRQIQAEKQNFIKEGKIKKEKPLPEITEDEILFDIPESWKWCRIGSVFTTSSGTTPLKSETAYWENGIFNWVRTTDLNNDILSECEIKITKKAIDECNLSFLPLNSVCIAMYGGAGTIGKNALINFETTINQSVCAIHSNRFCNMKYMLYFFQYYRKYWITSASGSRKDPNINKIIINKAIFPLPPLAEQKRIVQKLEEILPLCKKLKQLRS